MTRWVPFLLPAELADAARRPYFRRNRRIELVGQAYTTRAGAEQVLVEELADVLEDGLPLVPVLVEINDREVVQSWHQLRVENPLILAAGIPKTGGKPRPVRALRRQRVPYKKTEGGFIRRASGWEYADGPELERYVAAELLKELPDNVNARNVIRRLARGAKLTRRDLEELASGEARTPAEKAADTRAKAARSEKRESRKRRDAAEKSAVRQWVEDRGPGDTVRWLEEKHAAAKGREDRLKLARQVKYARQLEVDCAPCSGRAVPVRGQAKRQKLEDGQSYYAGSPTEVLYPAPGGRLGSYKAHYALVPSSAVVTSHDSETFSPSPGYPPQLQERDYKNDEGERQKVVRNSARFRPAFVLSTSPDAINGPPVVAQIGARLLVLGGNSRAMVIQRILARPTRAEPPNRATYSKALRESIDTHCEALGLEGVKSVKDRMLVRLLDEDLSDAQARDVSSALNRPFTQTLGTAAAAVSLGRRLPKELLELIGEAVAEEGTTLTQALAQNGARVVAMLRKAGIVQNENQAAYLKQLHGKFLPELSKHGRDRLVQALVGAFVGDKEALALMEPAQEALYQRLAPTALAIEQLAEGEYNLTPSLRRAVVAAAYLPITDLRALRDRFATVDIGELVGGAEDPRRDALLGDPLACILLLWLHFALRTPAKAGRALLEYWRGAGRDTPQAGLFGPPEPPPPQALRKATLGMGVAGVETVVGTTVATVQRVGTARWLAGLEGTAPPEPDIVSGAMPLSRQTPASSLRPPSASAPAPPSAMPLSRQTPASSLRPAPAPLEALSEAVPLSARYETYVFAEKPPAYAAAATQDVEHRVYAEGERGLIEFPGIRAGRWVGAGGLSNAFRRLGALRRDRPSPGGERFQTLVVAVDPAAQTVAIEWDGRVLASGRLNSIGEVAEVVRVDQAEAASLAQVLVPGQAGSGPEASAPEASASAASSAGPAESDVLIYRGKRQWRADLPAGYVVVTVAPGNFAATEVPPDLRERVDTLERRSRFKLKEVLRVPVGQIVERNREPVFVGATKEDLARWLAYRQFTRFLPIAVPRGAQANLARQNEATPPSVMAHGDAAETKKWARERLKNTVGRVKIQVTRRGRVVRVVVSRVADGFVLGRAEVKQVPGGEDAAEQKAIVQAVNAALRCHVGYHDQCDNAQIPPPLPWPPSADRAGRYTEAAWGEARRAVLELPEVRTAAENLHEFRRWLGEAYGEKAMTAFERGFSPSTLQALDSMVRDSIGYVAMKLGEPVKDERTPENLLEWRNKVLGPQLEHLKGALQALRQPAVWAGGANGVAALLKDTPASPAIRPILEYWYGLDQMGYNTLAKVERGVVEPEQRQAEREEQRKAERESLEVRRQARADAIRALGVELWNERKGGRQKPTKQLLERVVFTLYRKRAAIEKSTPWGKPKRTHYSIVFNESAGPELAHQIIHGPNTVGARKAIAGLIASLEAAAAEARPDDRQRDVMRRAEGFKDLLREEPWGREPPPPGAPSRPELSAPVHAALKPGAYLVDNPFHVPLYMRVGEPLAGQLDVEVDFAVPASVTGPQTEWLSPERLSSLARSATSVKLNAYTRAARRVEAAPRELGSLGTVDDSGVQWRVLNAAPGAVPYDLLGRIHVWKFWMQSEAPDRTRRWVYDYGVKWTRSAAATVEPFPVLLALRNEGTRLVDRVARAAGDFHLPGRRGWSREERAAELIYVAAEYELAEATWASRHGAIRSLARERAQPFVGRPMDLRTSLLEPYGDNLIAFAFMVPGHQADQLVRSWM